MATMASSSPRKDASAILKIRHSEGQDVQYSQIEESVKSLPGVSKARINYVTATIEVHYNPELVTLDKIRDTLRTLE